MQVGLFVRKGIGGTSPARAVRASTVLSFVLTTPLWPLLRAKLAVRHPQAAAYGGSVHVLEQAAKRLHRQGALGNLLANSQSQMPSGHPMLPGKPLSPARQGGRDSGVSVH